MLLLNTEGRGRKDICLLTSSMSLRLLITQTLGWITQSFKINLECGAQEKFSPNCAEGGHIWRGSVRFSRTEQKRRERQLEVSSKFISSFHVIIWRRYLIAPTACCKHQQALYHLTWKSLQHTSTQVNMLLKFIWNIRMSLPKITKFWWRDTSTTHLTLRSWNGKFSPIVTKYLTLKLLETFAKFELEHKYWKPKWTLNIFRLLSSHSFRLKIWRAGVPSVSYSRVAGTAGECCVARSAYLMLDTQVVM